MMFDLSLVSIFALILACSSKPLLSRRWDDFQLKHAWKDIPHGWEPHGTVSVDSRFNMRIGLKQNRFDELISTLYEVSDPTHEKYGQHLSKDDVDRLVAPHPDSVQLVESWLMAHGLDLADTQRSSAGDWITVSVSISQAERMLDTKYSLYRHSKSDEYVVRAMNYSIPSILGEHVAVIAPTTYFDTMKSMKATSFIQSKPSSTSTEIGLDPLATVPITCSFAITPTCLRELYNTSSYVPSATANNSLGIAGYLDQFANDADLQTFFEKFRPDAVGTTFTHVEVNGGGNDQSDPGVEANLDIQYAEGISFPTPNFYYSTGGSPPFNPDDNTPTNTNEPYLDWLDFILAQDNIPQTFTTSYGDDEQTVPIDYATTVCNLFAQLGARGSSILFSSGDSGVGGGDCLSNDGTNTSTFIPTSGKKNQSAYSSITLLRIMNNYE